MPHTRLAELAHELVEMRVAAKNQALTGFQYALDRNRPAAVAGCPVLEASLIGQGVHHPRLPASLLPEPGQSVIGDRLTGLLGVLAHQLADLAFREVA